MSKHTPGPWSYLPGNGPALHPAVQRGTEGGFIVQGLSRESEEADARLIAVAPEMLALLERWVSDPETISPNSIVEDETIALIAKVTGEAK